MGVRGASAWSETTYTDYLLHDIALTAQIVQYEFNNRSEPRTGADWEWWIGSDRLGWRCARVQAKLAKPVPPHYPELGHKMRSSGRRQIEVLIDGARRGVDYTGRPTGARITPYYCFYNGWPTSGAGWELASLKTATRRVRDAELVRSRNRASRYSAPIPWSASPGQDPKRRHLRYWGVAGMRAEDVLQLPDDLAETHLPHSLPLSTIVYDEVVMLTPGTPSTAAAVPASVRTRSVTASAGGDASLPEYVQLVRSAMAPASTQVTVDERAGALDGLSQLQILDEESGTVGVGTVGIVDLGDSAGVDGD
ncbi:DUF6615 family protein [Gordonia sputi]|uniref:DUF6615 family protein n=1 Tax=Gordonia sputi TaxID=36823 RepID=UPI003984346A